MEMKSVTITQDHDDIRKPLGVILWNPTDDSMELQVFDAGRTDGEEELAMINKFIREFGLKLDRKLPVSSK